MSPTPGSPVTVDKFEWKQGEPSPYLDAEFVENMIDEVLNWYHLILHKSSAKKTGLCKGDECTAEELRGLENPGLSPELVHTPHDIFAACILGS